MASENEEYRREFLARRSGRTAVAPHRAHQGQARILSRRADRRAARDHPPPRGGDSAQRRGLVRRTHGATAQSARTGREPPRLRHARIVRALRQVAPLSISTAPAGVTTRPMLAFSASLAMLRAPVSPMCAYTPSATGWKRISSPQAIAGNARRAEPSKTSLSCGAPCLDRRGHRPCCVASAKAKLSNSVTLSALVQTPTLPDPVMCVSLRSM